jgi:hypothetical protein
MKMTILFILFFIGLINFSFNQNTQFNQNDSLNLKDSSKIFHPTYTSYLLDKNYNYSSIPDFRYRKSLYFKPFCIPHDSIYTRETFDNNLSIYQRSSQNYYPFDYKYIKVGEGTGGARMVVNLLKLILKQK